MIQENEPLDIEATQRAFESLAATINSYCCEQDPLSKQMSLEEVALGFLDVANEAMCRPIRQLTEMKGYETSKHTLACFGGAGPQHACAIARTLGMRMFLCLLCTSVSHSSLYILANSSQVVEGYTQSF
jgi:5-oxoprolinase (ATP-hydrolysing)